MSSTHGLDALAALCGKTVSAVARSNDKSQRSGEESSVAASASASAPAPRPGPASSGQIPASNVGGTALPVFYQQQQLGQQQYFPQQQAAGMQQAAAAQQTLASMPPQLLQAMLSSQPGIGQALQAALAGGGMFAPTPQQPAAASLAAAFPGLAASAEQQQQQAQIQMIAAQLLAAQQQAAVGQMQQPAAKPPTNTSAESSVSSSKRPKSSPPKKRSPALSSANISGKGKTSSMALKPASVATATTTASTAASTIPSSKYWEDKKTAKRAANRLSAHLSRKRKKMFVDELRDENAELRRKAMILRSIPDLIVVFDSSGRMSFVSQSVSRFLQFRSYELENTSFWDRLTGDCVRVIKSAFMDALAVKRKPDDETTPLAEGEPIPVRLTDKDGKVEKALSFTLKGVVHFAGDSPECICTLCPEVPNSKKDLNRDGNGDATQVSDDTQC